MGILPYRSNSLVPMCSIDVHSRLQVVGKTVAFTLGFLFIAIQVCEQKSAFQPTTILYSSSCSYCFYSVFENDDECLCTFKSEMEK